MSRRICAQCGKPFIMPDPGSWVYRMRGWGPDDNKRMLSFCTFSCQEEYKKKFPDRKQYNRVVEK